MFLMETHASGDKARRQAKRTGFSGQYIVDSSGQSGGIWCLWDDNSWKVEILESTFKFVHTRVTWKGHISWLTTAVYASPRHNRRQQLWDDLSRISDTVDEAWVVLRDFNTIYAPHERKRGSSNFSDRSSLSFRNMINDCNLIDAGYQGSPFT